MKNIIFFYKPSKPNFFKIVNQQSSLSADHKTQLVSNTC